MTISEQDGMIYLDAPQREGKEGYIGTILTLFLQLGRQFTSRDFKETDISIIYHMQFMISMIPVKKNREAIREALKTEISKRMDEANKEAIQTGISLDNDDKARIRNMVYIEYIGEVMDWVDKHAGVSKENRIGFVTRKQADYNDQNKK